MKKILFPLFVLAVTLINCSNLEKNEFNNGLAAFEKEDYNNAIEFLKKVLNENYKNTDALILIGRSYLLLEGENFNSAIIYLKKALKYNPNNPDAYIYLGDAYQEKYSNAVGYDEFFRLLGEGKHPASEEAIKFYQKAINIKPDYALPYYKMGFMYGFRKNEIDEAIQWFKKGISINDNFTNVYSNIADLYRKKGNIDEAILNYEIEIRRYPNHLEPYLDLAHCYLKKDQNLKAISYLNEIMKKDPNFDGLNYTLGISYHNIDETKEVEFMKTAARLGDDNAKEWLKIKQIKW